MHPFKRIAGHVYFGYIAALFIATMLVVFGPIAIGFLISEPRRSHYLQPLFRGWMKVYLPLIGCPVRRVGQEVFRGLGPCVVVCNHNSFLDVPVTSTEIPGPTKTLAKAELARVPLFGLIYRAGSILVDRRTPRSRRESIARMEETVRGGVHLCLYPEGTRNTGPEPLRPFQDGAFLVAIKTGAPVVPAVLTNTRRVLPRTPKAWAWPARLEFRFLDPAPTASLTTADLSGLKAAVWSQMEEAVLDNRLL